MLLTFNLWQKKGTAPRLYVEPNTPFKAFLYLSRETSGEPQVFTNDSAEHIHLYKALTSSGIKINTNFKSVEDFVLALQAAGHTVHTKSRRPTPQPVQQNSVKEQLKDEYANTKSPQQLSRETEGYSLQSIKFLNPKGNYTVTIDTREPRSLVELFNTSGLNVVSEKLDQGDILITSALSTNQLLIERKTISDLYSSIISHTAHRQSECLYMYQQQKLAEGVRVSVAWLIEGELDGTRMLYNAFPGTNQTDGVVNFFAGIMGQYVFQCFNHHHLGYLALKLAQGFIENELVNKINAADRKSFSDTSQYHGVRTSDKNALMQVLMAIPSIKEPVARAIISKGHRFSDVMNYTESDWLSFDGVGKVLAKKILAEIATI